MRGLRVPATSLSSSTAVFLIAVRRQHFSLPEISRSRPIGFDNGTSKYWDKFYKRHQNKFFKDRHYLVKDWGKYFCNDDGDNASSDGKIMLEIGCGAGNSVFPLVAAYPKLFVHACDFSHQAIELVKSHVDFNQDQVNAFACDVVKDDLCETIKPSSVDVVTLVFMFSAVCPEKMPIILQNIKKVLKPKGYILLRDYALGDYAQVELHKRNRMISENFYARGDGTAGFSAMYTDIYSRQIQNRSQNITMYRRWIRATFCQFDCDAR